MKEFFVISHTHWDREWYQSFEEFRLRLVELIDTLMEIIDAQPEYIFHLDAQTCVLEDYLEVRPGKREQLYRYIRSGNILVGPWYLQNDFYLTSGESTIRNLLEGKKKCAETGVYDVYGYAPDQFGNISQLPQILRGFGIDTFIFARGYNEYDRGADGGAVKRDKPAVFLWEGADKSELTAVFMPFWYNNAQRFSADITKSVLLTELAERQFERIGVVPQILLMNGVDHLEPQPDILEVLSAVREETGKSIYQTSFPTFLNAVKEYIRDNGVTLSVHKGELNLGIDHELLRGCWSSRMYLKHGNVKAQNLLENAIEPLYSMLELGGMDGAYPSDHLRFLWKKLMLNQPHDSICGCSNDAVHRHNEERFESFFEAGNDILRRGLLLASTHIRPSGADDSCYTLLAVNSLEFSRDCVIEAEIEVKSEDGVLGFRLFDNAGKERDFLVTEHFTRKKDIFTPVNLPGVIDVEVFRISFEARLPQYSFNSFLLKPADKAAPAEAACNGGSSGGTVAIDNGLVKISADTSGVSFYDLSSGLTLAGFLTLEDSADVGDAYVYSCTDEKPLLFKKPSKVTLLRDDAFVKTLGLEYRCRIPECYDFEEKRRSGNKITHIVSLELSLRKNSDVAEIKYSFENRSHDHRLRLIFKSGIKSTVSFSDIPFDAGLRDNRNQYFATRSKTWFATSFAGMCGQRGIAVFNEGTHEYENLEDGRLAITVLRATGCINMGADMRPVGGSNWIVPENQSLRKAGGRLGVCAFTGKPDYNLLYKKAKGFRTPALLYSNSCDYKKFMGGRTAVQDTRLEEFFYKEDKYKGVKLPDAMPVLGLEGDAAVTALKKAEDGSGIVLRTVNLSETDKKFNVCLKGRRIASVQIDESEDGAPCVDAESFQTLIQAKRITTLKFTPPEK